MEAALEKVTVLSGGDIAAGLYPIATGTAHQFTGQVILRRVGIGVISTDWPRQQIIWIPTGKEGELRIRTRPEDEFKRVTTVIFQLHENDNWLTQVTCHTQL